MIESADLDMFQDYTSARELLSSLRSVNYLEYGTVCFTTAAGRMWEVYGSPVSVVQDERDP